MRYKSLKNIHFKKLGKEVLENGIIELDKDFADKVNKELKLTFMDVPKVLIPVDNDVETEVETETEEKPKRKSRKSKAETADKAAD
ncbi:TPA: hypothetical protein VBN14_001784 [Streptococcus agalactiae]|uniref:hypothetical protein n=1 Tax=Streptococcus agalactiae TaxID=1311 RepID=UPI0006406E10|nr:hypothetical protein [Streptococcus agalactiae]KLL24185.1 hypothetical protein VZ96_00630 [Streptococcus agalactiae]HEO7922200.1 hypothetical protein [Streptococcus agalactiae]